MLKICIALGVEFGHLPSFILLLGVGERQPPEYELSHEHIQCTGHLFFFSQTTQTLIYLSFFRCFEALSSLGEYS